MSRTRTVVASLVVMTAVLLTALWIARATRVDVDDPGARVPASAAADESFPGVLEHVEPLVTDSTPANTEDTQTAASSVTPGVRKVRLHIVDELGVGVGAASVTVWKDAAAVGLPYAVSEQGELVLRQSGSSRGWPDPARNDLAVDEGMSDANGWCVLDLPFRDAVIDASLGTAQWSGYWPASRLWGPAESEATLALRAQQDIHGSVQWAGGEPAAGALIWGADPHYRDPPDHFDAGWTRSPRGAIADERGEFVLVADSEYYGTVFARCRGIASVEKDLLFPPLEFVLYRGFAISGRVLAEDGSPVAEMDVVAELAAGLDQAQMETATDADGAYAFEIKHPGAYAVIPLPNEWAPHPLVSCDSATVIVNESHPQASADLFVCEGGHVTGRVLLDDGSPLDRALVSGTADLPLDAPQAGLPFLTEHTDVTGAFCIGPLSRSETYAIKVHLPESPSTFTIAGVKADQELGEIVIPRAFLAGGRFDVRIRNGVTGAAVADCDLSVSMFVAEIGKPDRQQIKLLQIAREGTGTFTVSGLNPECSYLLTVKGPDFPETSATPLRPAPEGTPVILRVNAFGDIACTVIDESASPMTACQVVLIPGVIASRAGSELAGWNTVVTDDLGRADFIHVPEGRWRLQAVAPGGRSSDMLEVGVTVGELSRLALIMSDGLRSGDVLIHASDRRGSPLSQVEFRLIPIESAGRPGPSDSTVGSTDGAGEARLVNVRRGLYRVLALHPEFGFLRCPTDFIQVDEGHTTEVFARSRM